MCCYSFLVKCVSITYIAFILWHQSTTIVIFHFFKIQIDSSKRQIDMSDTYVTVAICIGNEDSCYGYSFSSDPLRITTSIGPNPSSPGSLCFTIPTWVLFTKDKVFYSFGYESKQKYLDLLEDEEHKDCYFFERFLSRFTRQEVRRYS